MLRSWTTHWTRASSERWFELEKDSTGQPSTNIPPRYTHPQMPRCAICSHPQAAAITASLDLIGTRKTTRQFHGSLPAVNRHRQHVREERDAQ